MAGQGRLCQQTQSARWNYIAFRLRSTLTALAVLLLTGFGVARADDQTESSSSANLRVENRTGTQFHVADSEIEFVASIRSLTNHASRRLNWRVSLFRASDGDIVSTHRKIVPIDSGGNGEPMVFDFAAPDQPGVYEIRFELNEDDENLWQRFRKSKPPIASVGRPIFVVPASTEHVSGAAAESFRLALLHLPDLDWVNSLIDQNPYRPSADQDFLANCDPYTVRAMKLWAATRRLGKYIQDNGMSGAVLTADIVNGAQQYSRDLFPFDSDGASDQQQLETLNRLFAGHEIQLRIASRKSLSVIRLPPTALGKSESPGFNFEPLPQQGELLIGSILGDRDPNVLVIDPPEVGQSLGVSVQKTLRTFSLTPAKKFSPVAPVDPANATVHVRVGTGFGHGYVSLINLAPWSSEVDLDFATPERWEVVGGTDSEQAEFRQSEAQPSLAQITLRPGQLALLKTASETSDVSIRSWSAVVSGGAQEVERIKSEVTSVVERLGLLSSLEASGALTNGGFEQSGGIGLVGWMHAQHPPGCVKIDDKESIEGKHSVLLTTDPALSARTWIVSETIDAPDSGRLAVSLVMRAERVEDSQPHPMRVSIEATRNGEPIRYTGDFEVPRNGQWGSRQIVLETDKLEKQSVDALRLTIDSLSGGRVWLDDVRVHHQFPNLKEREELQSQAFLAVQGLQHGNLTPSSRLLQNQWARYLLAREPSKDVKPFVESLPADKPLGVAERIRSWLPRPIRF